MAASHSSFLEVVTFEARFLNKLELFEARFWNKPELFVSFSFNLLSRLAVRFLYCETFKGNQNKKNCIHVMNTIILLLNKELGLGIFMSVAKHNTHNLDISF